MQSMQNGVPDLCALTKSWSCANALVALAARYSLYVMHDLLNCRAVS